MKSIAYTVRGKQQIMSKLLFAAVMCQKYKTDSGWLDIYSCVHNNFAQILCKKLVNIQCIYIRQYFLCIFDSTVELFCF